MKSGFRLVHRATRRYQASQERHHRIVLGLAVAYCAVLSVLLLVNIRKRLAHRGRGFAPLAGMRFVNDDREAPAAAEAPERRKLPIGPGLRQECRRERSRR